MTFKKKIILKQRFKINKFLLLLKKLTPKVKGYWMPIKYLFKFLPSKFNTLIEFEDFNFSVPIDLKDPYQIDIFFKDKYELLEPWIISKLLPDDGIFFDVGANCGWYSRIVSTCKPNSLIFAFEPNKFSFEFLKQFCSYNLITLPTAVGDDSSDRVSVTNPFYRQPSGSFMIKSKDGVSVISLDDFSEKLNLKPNFIKIDVEGYELNVLKGASNLLQFIDYILIEVNNPNSAQNCNYDFNTIYECMYKNGLNYAYDIRNGTNEIIEVEKNIMGGILFSRKDLRNVI